MSNGQLQKLRYSHEAIVDAIVADPTVTQRELAKAFGFTESYLSIVMNSDAFRERLVVRRAEMVDPVLLATVTDKFQALTQKSLDVLLEAVHRPLVSEQLALQAAQLGAKALGVGGFSSKTAPPAAQPADERLNRLAGRLLGLMGAPGGGASEVVDVESKNV